LSRTLIERLSEKELVLWQIICVKTAWGDEACMMARRLKIGVENAARKKLGAPEDSEENLW
jgi:hypothetical protein